MGNTTHETQKEKGFLARIRQKLTKRKRRIMRLIELKRLQRIRKKTVPGYTYCKNCGTKLEGMYCHCCGQYALDIYQPFWKYFKQYFENVYQFDSKIWQTLWFMFTRPGFLTNEFNAGKINSYVHPFRLYMCISVVFFTLFFMLASDKANQALQAVDSLSINDEVVQQLNSGTALPDTSVYLYQGPELVQALQERGVSRTDKLFQVQRLDDRFLPFLCTDAEAGSRLLPAGRQSPGKRPENHSEPPENENLPTGQSAERKRNQFGIDASGPPLPNRLHRKSPHTRVRMESGQPRRGRTTPPGVFP